METNDETLMTAHRAGDPAAFGALVSRYAGPLLGYLMRMVGQAKGANVKPFRRKALWFAAAAAVLILLGSMALWRHAPVDGLGGGDQIATNEQRNPDPEIAALRATDPFLPGSNIELNVLPTRENVQLTIYNAADLTLVRERRTLTMKKGWNWLQFMWANTLIDPTSLQLETVNPEQRGKVEVQSLVFPPRIRELGRWLLFSEVSGPVPVEITYLTSGLSWRAFYAGTLAPDEKTMKLQGYVRATNKSGEDYENAQTRLIVGKVNLIDQIVALASRKHAYGSPLEDNAWGKYGNEPNYLEDSEIDGYKDAVSIAGYSNELKHEIKKIEKEGLSEYFLYTIEGRENIKNGWAKRLPSFAAEDIPVESLYKYDEDRWGGVPMRFVSFKNDKEHKLGESPIPDGSVRISRRLDEEQHLAYIGAADIKYVPVDEDIELNLGAARQVTVEPRVMAFSTENHLFDKHGNVDGWDELRTWRLRVANTRNIAVKLEITRNFGSAKWELVTDEKGYEKHNMSHGRFTLNLPPFTQKDVVYTLRTYHGRRAQ